MRSNRFYLVKQEKNNIKVIKYVKIFCGAIFMISFVYLLIMLSCIAEGLSNKKDVTISNNVLSCNEVTNINISLLTLQPLLYSIS